MNPAILGRGGSLCCPHWLPALRRPAVHTAPAPERPACSQIRWRDEFFVSSALRLQAPEQALGSGFALGTDDPGSLDSGVECSLSGFLWEGLNPNPSSSARDSI